MDKTKNDRYYVEQVVRDVDWIIADAKRARFSDLEKNDPFLDAIGFRLNSIRESVKGLSPEFVSAHPTIDFTTLVSFRNAITHNYESIDMGAYRDLVKKDLPDIRKVLLAYLR